MEDVDDKMSHASLELDVHLMRNRTISSEEKMPEKISFVLYIDQIEPNKIFSILAEAIMSGSTGLKYYVSHTE